MIHFRNHVLFFNSPLPLLLQGTHHWVKCVSLLFGKVGGSEEHGGGGSLKSCEIFVHRHLYSVGSAKEGMIGTRIALQNPLPVGMRGAELGSGMFRFSDVTLTSLAQVVSNGLSENVVQSPCGTL